MAHSPPDSGYPTTAATITGSVGTGYRVVRIHRHVTEAYVAAGSIAAALTAAKALPPSAWKTRAVLQTQPGLEDQFEYDVVASDV
jgi:hypothetical protein